MGWTFTWLRSWDEIWADRHLERWKRAIARPDAHATPFMHPDLARVWLRSMGGEAGFRPYFLCADHDGGQQVLWLLVRQKTGWRQGFVRSMVPIGGALFDYGDPIVVPSGAPDDVVMADFWVRIEQELHDRKGSWFDLLDLPGIPSEGVGTSAPGDAAPTSPFIRLNRYADFDQYMSTRKGNFRHEIQRQQRRLADAGAVRFVMHAPSEIATVLAWLPAFEAEKRKRYPETPYPEGYFRNLVTEGMAAGMVKCSSISLEGQSIAWALGFHLADTFYGYITSFDGHFARFSPGSLHLYHIVQWAFAANCSTLDLLSGDETYKAAWTDGAAFRRQPLVVRSRAPATLSRRCADRSRQLCLRLAAAAPLAGRRGAGLPA